MIVKVLYIVRTMLLRIDENYQEVNEVKEEKIVYKKECYSREIGKEIERLKHKNTYLINKIQSQKVQRVNVPYKVGSIYVERISDKI